MSLMKIYTQYISNYSNSTIKLRELQDDPIWCQWKQAQETKLGGMTLSSLLIMPVQRVPRYILLLRDLYKHTWITHPDYANLQRAALEMEELTQFLDMKKKQSENLNRLATLAANLKGKISVNLAEAHRKFIREDKFENFSIYLFNDLFIITEYTEDKKLHLDHGRSRSFSANFTESQMNHNLYWISNSHISTVSDTGFDITIKNSPLTIILDVQVGSKDLVDEWVDNFNLLKSEGENKAKEQKKNNEKLASAASTNAMKLNPNVRNSVSGCVTLTRADSLKSLQNSLEMLHSHIKTLDTQIKTVKNKKEKKQISKLKSALDEQVLEVDKKVTAKLEERKDS